MHCAHDVGKAFSELLRICEICLNAAARNVKDPGVERLVVGEMTTGLEGDKRLGGRTTGS